MSGDNRSLYKKYRIERVDGKILPETFDSFVLRFDSGASENHRYASLLAVHRYAEAIESELPELAGDIFHKYGPVLNSLQDRRDLWRLKFMTAIMEAGQTLEGATSIWDAYASNLDMTASPASEAERVMEEMSILMEEMSNF